MAVNNYHFLKNARLNKISDSEYHLNIELSVTESSFLKDHSIEGRIIVPAAIQIEILFEIGSYFFNKNMLEIHEFVISRKMEINCKRDLLIRMIRQKDALSCFILSDIVRKGKVIRKNVLHTKANIRQYTELEKNTCRNSWFTQKEIFISCQKIYSKQLLFHGDYFQGLMNNFTFDSNSFSGYIKNHKKEQTFFYLPVVLDNAFQIAALWDIFINNYRSLPISIDKLHFYPGNDSSVMYCRGVVARAKENTVSQSLFIFNDKNELVLSAKNFIRERIAKANIEPEQFMEG